jgi:hypothetical protein
MCLYFTGIFVLVPLFTLVTVIILENVRDLLSSFVLMFSLSSQVVLEILCNLLNQLIYYFGTSVLKEAGITFKVTFSLSVYYMPS